MLQSVENQNISVHAIEKAIEETVGCKITPYQMKVPKHAPLNK